MDSEPNSILAKYENLLGKKSVARIKKKADELQQYSILNVNSTKFGGGVAEILNSMLPLMKELGLDVDWRTFTAPDKFFEISKKMHNALQGNMDIHFTDEEIAMYKKQASDTYKQVNPNEDFVIIHDPQPCPVIGELNKKGNKWIWRCHIDTSEPNPQAWGLISDYLPMYDALIFTKMEFARKGIHENIYQITPSINPFSPKNKMLDHEKARKIVEKFIPLDKPLISQVSRFDPWKDPLGVIDVYRKVNEEIPIHLALIGSLAHDDPEGAEWLEKIKNYSRGDENIHVLSNLDGIADLEVNAFQSISDVILQKSIREGFGLTVTEALWKETPVIGGNVGGIQLQIEDGLNGFLVNSIDEAADRVLYLLKHPERAKEMGKNGREKVKNNVNLFRDLIK